MKTSRLLDKIWTSYLFSSYTDNMFEEPLIKIQSKA